MLEAQSLDLSLNSTMRAVRVFATLFKLLLIMRIDSHQHFWRYNPTEYAWISEKMAALQRDFLPSNLEAVLARVGFQGTVAVQARQSLEETLWLLELATRYPFIRAVVGWVDLRSEELPSRLERLAEHPKLAGVRHVIQDEPDDDFLLRPDFRRGISRLREFELTYDLLLYPKHLPAAIKLVAEFPGQPFVLDHIAKPKIAEHLLSPWREHIKALAALPNVCCKLSGMVTETEWGQWQAQDFRPYLDIVFDAFGTKRLMIGSDWPVCTLSGDYAQTMHIVIDYVRQFSDEEQAAVLGGNCARFYQIDDHATSIP
jgi:L-fuconolactonase